MSIIAIVKTGTGQAAVEEFREAASEGAAVDEFVGEYDPAANPDDYLGHDPNWGEVQSPGADKKWHYDHDSPGLVALLPESPLAMASLIAPEDANKDFRTINYKSGLIGSLHKVRADKYRGEMRVFDYYTDASKTTLVLRVQIYADADLTVLGYDRTDLGSPIQRWTKRTWYREDGTPHPSTKVTHKVYAEPEAQMEESERRRTNQVRKLKLDVLQAYVFNTAVDPMNPTAGEIQAAYEAITVYMGKYGDEVSLFIEAGRNDFLTPPASPNVTDDVEAWLDYDVSAMGYPPTWTIRKIILESVKNINEA